MKKIKFGRTLMSVVLVVAMLMGTCVTSFASVLDSVDVAAVENVVNDVKAEIEAIIEVATGDDDAAKAAMVDEYVAELKAYLVAKGVSAAELDSIEAQIRAEVDEVIAVATGDDEAAKEEKVDAYVTYIKDLIGLTPEEEAYIGEVAEDVKAEVEEFVNATDEEKEAMVAEYAGLLKEELNITAEDEAKIAELVAEIEEIISIIENTSAEDVEAVVDAYIAELAAKAELEVAKLGHKKYVADEDSYYVAIGGDTVIGTGLTYPNNIPYYGLVADELNIPNVASVATSELLYSEVYDYVIENAAEIENADFITYQTDASAFIYALLYETPDWSKYIDAETQMLLDDIVAATVEVIEEDWDVYANAEISEVAETVKAEVRAIVEGEVAEYITIDADELDALIDQVVGCVSSAISLVETEKDEIYTTINGLDETVVDYAEKLAYAVVSYAVETVKTIEAIQTINPEAVVYVVGMYNPFNGVQIVTDGETIDAGEVFDYIIAATNLYYAGYAAVNGNIAFVDVTETTTNGSATTTVINVNDIDFNAPGAALDLLHTLEGNMLANAAGHEYIKDQIVAATECNYSLYEAIDEDTHALKCVLCGDVKETEAHDFGEGTVCTKCGYEKVVPTPTPAPVYGGGGSGVSRYTVKFDTNGGSAIANVFVKKGEVLAKPANPTKDGYTFDGWYTDKELTNAYDFSQPVTKSFTLYAKWIDRLTNFTDVDKDAWYYDYVKTIVEKGLMKGVSETEFAPNMTLTRGMFVTILNRIEDEAKAEGELVFTDVAADAYYAEAIKWANANGIVKGISETEYAPDVEITREQMAAIIARYAEFKGIEVTAEGEVVYTDSDSISEYAKEAVVTAKHLGLLIGNDDGSFAPQRNTTRAEAAALFVRLLGVIGK